MKSYTNLEQSKMLAEFLPIESADMHYIIVGTNEEPKHIVGLGEYIGILPSIPCWSLAALMELMPKHIKQEDGRIYKFYIFNDDGRVIQRWGCSYVAKDYHNRAEYLSDPTLKYPTNVYSGKYDNPVDSCYEMILKLNELKLI